MRHDLGHEARNGCRPLRLAAQLVGYAEDRETLRMQCAQVQRCDQLAIHIADGGQATFESHRTDVLREQIHKKANPRVRDDLVERR